MKITKRISSITDSNLQYAKQLGVDGIIGYLPDARSWEYPNLVGLRTHVETHGLELLEIGAPPPDLWRQIKRATPQRDEAISALCDYIRNMGRAGIPILGYNFALLDGWGRWREGLTGGGRGNAGIMSFDYDLVKDVPPGELGTVVAEEVWNRIGYFLGRVIPVAEEAGVKLACHPDDPPVRELRGVARVQSSLGDFDRLIDTVVSPSNGLTFCVGTVAEMGVDVRNAIRHFCDRQKIFVVHFRNVCKLPGDSLKYDEVFIDEGDLDMFEILQALADADYEGLLDPDHAPVMIGDSQWGRERGYAYALGYISALRRFLA